MTVLPCLLPAGFGRPIFPGPAGHTHSPLLRHSVLTFTHRTSFFFALCIRCVSEEFVSLRSVVLSLALDDFFRRRKLSVCVSFAMSPSSDRS